MIIFCRLILAFSPSVTMDVCDSSTSKGVFVQTPIKYILFSPRYVIQEKKEISIRVQVVSIVLWPSISGCMIHMNEASVT